jgi:UDP-3-O-[3-hydroxymyristoyl] glucosamine N-acyltransferase
MPITLGKLAEMIDAQIPAHHSDYEISGIKSLQDAKAGDISFFSNDKYKQDLDQTKASAVILSKSRADIAAYNWIPIIVNDVPLALSKVLNVFAGVHSDKKGICPSAIISDTANISEHSFIGSHVVLGKNVTIADGVQLLGNNFIGDNVEIGKNTIIHPGANILFSCQVGENCVIQSNTVIGSDGFGYVLEGNQFHKVPHIGNVVLENDVEIGANCTIDRGSVGSTRIKRGTKLDNLIQIAHNVEIGEHTVMAAQSGIAGSTKIGSYCQIGGQAGIVGHLKIADLTKIQAQSGVTKNVKKSGTKLYGYPAIEYNNYLRSYAGFKNIPDLIQRLNMLESQLRELQRDNESKDDKTTS